MHHTPHTPAKALGDIGIWSKITVLTWFWELLPCVWTEISAGRGCREELNITKCYIFYVLTIAPTEIPILQSPGRQIDDFREGWFLQKGSWRAAPPDPEAKTTRFGSRMAATPRRSIIMTEYGIASDARQLRDAKQLYPETGSKSCLQKVFVSTILLPQAPDFEPL